MRLPSEYQEVEYIQSSGTQYFIIGNTFKTSYKSVIDFQMITTGSDYVPLGVRDATNYRYGIDAWNGYFQIISGGSDWTSTIREDKNRHSITVDKNTATVDGTNYSISYVNHTFSDGIGVFYYHSIGGNSGYYASIKLYKLDIYDENGNHIFDGYPCYRKSDNVIGLYDLVNNQFYTNSGTGTFTKGADIKGYKIKKVYIGTIEIWPGEEKDNWILFDESDFATSTPSKNSQFHYSGWNGTTYWTNTSYDTANKRIYANNSHCLAGFILNDSTALVGAKKIKIVGDYAYCYNSNTYSSGVHLMPFNLSMTYSLSVNGETGTTYSPALNTFLTHSTPYSSEFIYDFDTDSGTLKVTNLSNQTETQCTVTGFKQYWDSKVNSGSLELFSMYKDQGSSSYLGDYHIYYVPGGEPAPQSGSVDFTTTSRAALSADGWTYTNETPGIDSGGFYCSNTSNDKSSRLWHPINLSNANKIYIKTAVNGSNSSWAGGPSFGIAKDTAHSYPYVSGNLSFTSQSGYNYQGLYVNPDGTDLVSKNNFNIGGAYTLEITVDFDIKRVYYNLSTNTSPVASVWAAEIFMSDSVASAIRQCAYIKCEAAHGIYSGARIRSIEWDIT